MTNFDEKQWSKLQEIMKRGSSKKQLKTIQKSKNLKNIKVEF